MKIGLNIKYLCAFIVVFIIEAIIAVLVEVGQYFNLAELLDLSDYKIARIIIDSTFNIKDIVKGTPEELRALLQSKLSQGKYLIDW